MASRQSAGPKRWIFAGDNTVKILALRKLIGRCERSDVTNPAGLLRACITDDALREEPTATEELARLRTELAHYDEAIPRCRSGFDVIRLMRKRDVERRASEGGDDGEPVATPCADHPDLAEPIAEVARLLELLREAKERDDALAVRRVEEGLLRLENTIDEVLCGKAGQVS